MVEVALAPLKQPDQKFVGGGGFNLELPPIQAEENVRRKKRYTLVSVNAWMVHEQRFEESCCHFRHVSIISGSWAVEGTFEEAEVTHASPTPKSFYKGLVDRKNLVERQVLDDLTGQGVSPVLRFPP